MSFVQFFLFACERESQKAPKHLPFRHVQTWSKYDDGGGQRHYVCSIILRLWEDLFNVGYIAVVTIANAKPSPHRYCYLGIRYILCQWCLWLCSKQYNFLRRTHKLCGDCINQHDFVSPWIRWKVDWLTVYSIAFGIEKKLVAMILLLMYQGEISPRILAVDLCHLLKWRRRRKRWSRPLHW